MISIYLHKTNPIYLYAEITDAVVCEDIHYWEEVFLQTLDKTKPKRIIIFNYTGAFLQENKYYIESAKVATRTGKYVSKAVYIGLVGIQKYFFQLYKTLLPKHAVPQPLYDSVSELEHTESLLITDFILYKTNKKG